MPTIKMNPKRTTKLENGMERIYTICGDRVTHYKTMHGFREALRRRDRLGFHSTTWMKWKCKHCGHGVATLAWAKRHNCKA